MIDMRSDTVTSPTIEMREAIYYASVGDDVYGEDETIQTLERRVANLFGKEAALFFPTGTMSNLTALLTWCPTRGSEVIVGDKSHMFLFEQAGASQFGGISPRTVPNLTDGTMDLEQISWSIRDDDIHEPVTKLICIENTHNACGGKILSLSFMQGLHYISKLHGGLPIHLDGARIWNAIQASGTSPRQYGELVDSISVCLSKGLGAPAGSLLLGTREFIRMARRTRKALGGGMRQVGILGAAGLKALDDYETGILHHDHVRAQTLVDEIRQMTGYKVRSPVHTNIIFIDILYIDATKIVQLFKERGVLLSEWGTNLIRLVIHRDITDADIYRTIDVFRDIDNIVKMG